MEEREIRKFDSNHLLALIYNHSSGGRPAVRAITAAAAATHKSPPALKLTYIGKRGEDVTWGLLTIGNPGQNSVFM